MMGLTPRQTDAFEAIRSFTDEFGYAPSYAELRDRLGLASKGCVVRLVDALQARGLVERDPHRARSVRVVGELEGLEQRSSADLRALRNRIDEILRRRVS